MRRPKVAALIFDFDGLILDTETLDYTVLSEQYQAHGATLRIADWVTGLGSHGAYDPYAELELFVGARLDRDVLVAAHRQRYRELCEQSDLLPGVRALLEAARARDMPAAVASSSNREWVEGWLARHAIREFFQCVRTRDDVERVKPAPDLFLSAAECLEIAPEGCVVLEDSLNGMRAAHAAGMRCVGVPIALLDGIELPPVSMRLRSLADITLDELVEQLELH